MKEKVEKEGRRLGETQVPAFGGFRREQQEALGSLFPRATSQADMLTCSVSAQIPVQNIQKFAHSGLSGERVGSQGLQRRAGILPPAMFNDRADIPLNAAEIYLVAVGHCGKDHLPREEKKIFIVQSKFQGSGEVAEAFVPFVNVEKYGEGFQFVHDNRSPLLILDIISQKMGKYGKVDKNKKKIWEWQ